MAATENKAEEFELKCTTITGDKFDIAVTASMTVRQVKEAIAELKPQLIVDNARLVCGKSLLRDDEKSLADYNVLSETPMRIIIRMTTISLSDELLEGTWYCHEDGIKNKFNITFDLEQKKLLDSGRRWDWEIKDNGKILNLTNESSSHITDYRVTFCKKKQRTPTMCLETLTGNDRANRCMFWCKDPEEDLWKKVDDQYEQ